MNARKALAAALCAVVAASGLVVGTPQAPATAAVAADFDPGAIISDATFYDYGSMSESDIQRFLNDKGRNCTAGERPCLKDYRENTPTRPVEIGLCWQYTGAANESAARILTKVATACEINPRVLLVLLEKENSLVTRTRPTARNYDAATGFGCPDTAPCNTEYYGFANQVYRAARQYLVYRNNATRYGYQAGRTNTILYHPNAACGSGKVYIQNQATAALYIYTPYQPNAAALKNLYGTGDSCSSYGNRNFWRLFSDWFGDPWSGSFLVRTPEDPKVYLLSGTRKHYVPDLAVYNDYVGRLGPVGYLSSAALARYTLARDLGRVVRDATNGSIYWIAQGAKHHFPSCDVVVRWTGSSCETAYVDLTSEQITAFPDGQGLASAVRTSSGRSYWVEGAQKREILDDASRAAAGIPAAQVSLPDTTLAALAVGAPIVRSDVVVTERGSSNTWLLMASVRHPLKEDVRAGTPLRGLPQGSLDAASLAKIPAGSAIGMHVRNAAGAATALLTADGLVPAPPGSPAGTLLSPGVAALLPVRSGVGAPYFVKASNDPMVWAMDMVGTSTQRRAVTAWQDLQAFAGPQPRVLTLAPSQISAVPRRTGPWLVPGRLVKAPGAPEIYLVDGIARAVHVESFADVSAIGLSRSYSTADADSVRTHTAASQPLSPVVRCAPSTVMVGVAGRLTVRGVQDPPAVPVTDLSPAVCSRLPAPAGAPSTGPLFLKGSGATIYLAEGSTRRPISSWAVLQRLNAGHGSPLIATLSDAAVNRIPLGPTVS